MARRRVRDAEMVYGNARRRVPHSGPIRHRVARGNERRQPNPIGGVPVSHRNASRHERSVAAEINYRTAAFAVSGFLFLAACALIVIGGLGR